MQQRSILCLGALALLTPAATAQLPSGAGVRFSFNNNPLGMEIIDLSGVAAPIPFTGYTGSLDVVCGVLDSATGDLIVAGANTNFANTGSQITRVQVNGSTVISQTVLLDTGNADGYLSLAFNSTGELFAVNDGAVVRINPPVAPSVVWTEEIWDTGTGFESMTIDPATDRMWVSTEGTGLDEIFEYDLSAGPAAGTSLFDLTLAGFMRGATSMTYDAAADTLYCASRRAPYTYEYNFGTATATTTVGGLVGNLEGIAIDPATGLVHYTIGVNFSGDYGAWHSVDLGAGTTAIVDTGFPPCGGFCSTPVSWDLLIAPTVDLYTNSCNGDGGNQMGCTNCPCGNNSIAGTPGGCINSAGSSAALEATGSASVSLPSGDSGDLRFALSGVPANAFCILNSGDAVAPGNPANPCFGLNSGAQAAAFDGLRCAIQNTRRHGGRSADGNGDVGVTNSPWGGEGGPPVGIAVAGGGFGAGQTRFFQVINRDDALQVCMRGLNTSQAVQVTFTP